MHFHPHKKEVPTLQKRIIQEWDGTTEVVQLEESESGDNIIMIYDDGTQFLVTKAYLDSITIRTFAD